MDGLRPRRSQTGSQQSSHLSPHISATATDIPPDLSKHISPQNDQSSMHPHCISPLNSLVVLIYLHLKRKYFISSVAQENETQKGQKSCFGGAEWPCASYLTSSSLSFIFLFVDNNTQCTRIFED